MQTFEYGKAKNLNELQAIEKTTRYLAGGTNLIDLMKLDVETPNKVIDVNQVSDHRLNAIEEKDHTLFVGALVRNSDLAYDARVKKKYSVLSQAILAGASAQLRNKATTSGNLLQRTRCVYFRDPTKKCNKRVPGSGCDALQGHNRNLAILGTSDHCIANNPSDMNVAMMALDAVIHTVNSEGERQIPIQDFYLLPEATPHLETVLKPGEFITGVSLPEIPKAAKQHYLKLRDRQSYEFALASAAIVAEVKSGVISSIRIAMGGIGAKPWRCKEAEAMLLHQAPHAENFALAAEATLKMARPQSQNEFKIELAKRCLIHALQEATS
jgi:xanthine dehydrogenase YagS FAD-binding subunit